MSMPVRAVFLKLPRCNYLRWSYQQQPEIQEIVKAFYPSVHVILLRMIGEVHEDGDSQSKIRLFAEKFGVM